MKQTTNTGSETPSRFTVHGAQTAKAGAGYTWDAPTSEDAGQSSHHDPEAKALLRRYLADIHSYREIGNHALRDLEVRLATQPNEGAWRDTDTLAHAAGRLGHSSALTQPSLPAAPPKTTAQDASLQQRLSELSSYLHADLTKDQSGRAGFPPPLPASPPAQTPPHAHASHKTPSAPVLDRAWFEERFAALRGSIDDLAEQIPLNRIAALESQFQDLMERLTAREAARDPRPLDAALKELATYLSDSKHWAVATDARVKGVEDKIDRLSGLVAQSHAAISATAHGLEVVAKGTGGHLARATANLVMTKIGERLEHWNPADRLDQLGREVAHLTAQSRHLARGADDRLQQIQAALHEKTDRSSHSPAPNAQAPLPFPPAKRTIPESGSRDELESYLNREPLDDDDDYDSDMIAAAQRAAHLADGPARNAPSQTGPVRYQIPYGDFLPDEESPASHVGLIAAVVILLLAGAAMLFLKVKEWPLIEPKPAASLSEAQPPAAAQNAQRAPTDQPAAGPSAAASNAGEGDTASASTMDITGVTGAISAAPALASKPFQLWVSASNTADSAMQGAEQNAPAAAATEPEESFRGAAVKGDLDAQFSVAQSYLAGQDGENSLTGNDRMVKAARWFRRAAENGHAPSQYRLATLYELGRGAPKDLTQAESWYVRAAKQGHVKAMHNLAVLSAAGNGRSANYLTAARWFKEAAEHGLTDSQYNLGILYERGLGVARNLTEAYRWFTLAVRENDTKALQKRDEVGRLLSLLERQKAERLVSAWTMKATAEAVNSAAPEPPATLDNDDQPASPPPAQAASAAVMRASWKAEIASRRDGTGARAIVADAQQRLKQLGYNPGPVDGIPGPRTEAAIRQFQRQTGLAPTGQISESLVVRMAFLPI